MIKYLFFILMFGYILSSCHGDDIISEPSQLVIEGWIDAGGFPVVIVTKTVPIDKNKQQLSSLEEYLVKWAKVTVSDGEQEFVLTGKMNEHYFPPYVYTTTALRGVEGKTYKLTVTFDDYFAEAWTTIPPKVELDSFYVEKNEGMDNSYNIIAHINNNTSENKYYKFFTYTSDNKYQFYSSSYRGLVNGSIMKNNVSIPIYRSKTIENWEHFNQYFSFGEIVNVKLVRLDLQGYNFWNSYEVVSSLSRNPLFPVSESLESNIQGALGYWLGYGASEYRIDIK